MFSISTVASSTRMPTASASPPSVITLSEWPSANSSTIDDRIDSGIETATISVLRQLPRNSRIIAAVSRPAMMLSMHDAFDRRLHEQRLVEQQFDLQALAGPTP